MISRKIAYGILWTGLFVSGWILARDQGRIEVSTGDGSRLAGLASYRDGGVTYVSLQDFAKMLGVKSVWVQDKKKMILRVGSQALVVTALNPFILAGETMYQMPLPTLMFKDVLYVPLTLFLQAIGNQFSSDLQYDPQTENLRILPGNQNITGIEVETRDNGSVIRIITTREFNQSDVSAFNKDRWVNITLYGGRLDSARIAAGKPGEYVRQILPFQFEKSAQISLFMGHDIADTKVFTQPGEIIVTARSNKEIQRVPINSTGDDRRKWLIHRIVLDPGHGGKDPGAVGPSGFLEKTVTLDICKRLKKLIEDRTDVEVVMTREDDTFVPLYERTRFANAKDGKLFISVHANGNKNRSVHGYSTYVLGTAKNEEALELAEKENSVIDLEESSKEYEGLQDAVHILNAIAQSSYLKESLDLGKMVNESMSRLKSMSQFGRGVYQAGFIVLIGPAMPRILVEAGFLTNTYEERLLKTKTFRQRIAESMFESIMAFKKKYEQGIE